MASFHYKWLKQADFYGKVSPKYMRRKSNYPLWLEMLLVLFLLFVVWTQMLNYLEGEEFYSFRVDGGNTVETALQINVDLTVATPCSAIVVNVLDKSNDRMFATEVLQLDEVEFSAPRERIAADPTAGKDDKSVEDDKLGGSEDGRFLLDTLGRVDASIVNGAHGEISSQQLERRSESLFSVLRHARQSRAYRKSAGLSARKKQELAARDEAPPQAYTDGSVGCRVYGSFPVTKVQGTLHVISKAVFLSGGRLSMSERRLLTSQRARDDMWAQHRNRFPPSHYLFAQVNFTHYIDELSFGTYYPRVVNPLDGTTSRWPVHALRHRLGTFLRKTAGSSPSSSQLGIAAAATSPEVAARVQSLLRTFKDRASAVSIYNYFVSIVPTTYKSSRTGRRVDTNQYAVTEQVRDLSWDYQFDDTHADIDAGPADGTPSPLSAQEREQLGALKSSLFEAYDAATAQAATPQPPGIFFQYDIDPVLLEVTEHSTSFKVFLLRLTNILAGIYVLFIAFTWFVLRKGRYESETKMGLLDDGTLAANVAYAPN